MHNDDAETDALEATQVKKHLSPELLALLRKAQDEETADASTLEIVAAIARAFTDSGLLEFVYLPEDEDDERHADPDDEPVAWFAVEQVEVDAERGSVILFGDVTHVLNPPITLEGIEDDEDEDR
ncbi:MAG TPA: hypothetical protein VIG32_03840 [Candidatus Baltobacteraceae bacterium]|jgi:hypothetical protein